MAGESRRHGKSFGAMLGVLSQVSDGEMNPDLDRHTKQLWLYTLAGMGYIERTREGRYTVTKKGSQALKRRDQAGNENSAALVQSPA